VRRQALEGLTRHDEGVSADRVTEHARPPETAGRVAAAAFAVMLILPVRDLFRSHPSSARLALVLTGAAGFSGVFLWRLVFTPGAARHPPRSTWLWLGVCLALAIALVAGDGAQRWAPLFIFLSAMVGVRIAMPWAAYGIGACGLAAAVVLAPTSPFDNTFAVTLEALGIGALTVGMRKLRATITELQEAREQLAQLAVTEERLRFARDLHDLLGHSLSLIALKAEVAGRLVAVDADRAAKEVADIDAVARDALVEVRQAVSGYRQPTLAEAVSTGRLALAAAGIDTTWDVADVALPEGIDAVLGWAVREAVTNVVRHSRARRCWVRVTAGLIETAAEVSDDGVGHDACAGAGDGVGHDACADAGDGVGDGLARVGGDGLPEWAGNGLTGLAERVSELGGHLEVACRPEGGFRLRASVPTPAALSGAHR
jgi:two-component system sensor histidine kinase DesK